MKKAITIFKKILKTEFVFSDSSDFRKILEIRLS